MLSFKKLANKFLKNNKDPNRKEMVADMLKNVKEVGCCISLKLAHSLLPLKLFSREFLAMSKVRIFTKISRR